MASARNPLMYTTRNLSVLCLIVALWLPACGCGDDEAGEGETEGQSTADSGEKGEEKGIAEAVIDAVDGDGDEESDRSDKPAPLLESRSERLQRLAAGDVRTDAGFDVTVLSLQLVKGRQRDRLGRKTEGIQLRMSGLIRNLTGKTLSSGFVSGALVLRFGNDVAKVRLSPGGFKPEVSPEKPWRNDTQRLFTVETYVFPELMLEYEPDKTEARVFVAFRDPIDFEVEAAVWKADINWLAARVAPIRGKGQVYKAESIRMGPRGKAVGKLANGESVDLLYQSRDWYLVKARDGTGWVSNTAVLVTDPHKIYDGAAPHTAGNDASDSSIEIKVVGLESTDEVPPGVKLDEGERMLLVNLELTNKGDKTIKCTDVFVDYGGKNQVLPSKYTDEFKGALDCEGGKLESGSRATGKLAYVRERHEIPVSVGIISPAKNTLRIDVYDLAQTKPYTR